MSPTQSEEKLLSILHTHGQQFLSAFNIPAVSKCEVEDPSNSESEEEWTGFGSSPRGTSRTTSDGEDDGSEHPEDFVARSRRTPDVMVFLESTREQATSNLSSKELRRAFMSSKVSNITSSSAQPTFKDKIPDEESDDERTNAQNDALLHRLVHTKLLSGSLNPELNLNHAQRGSALAGRVLELAGEAKLGKGESKFRQHLRNKAAKHTREGLNRKQREKDKKTLEEAKNLGNYHPILKRVYDSNSTFVSKKRLRGLGMGVGKFVGGTLKLSREEIVSVTGSRKRPRDDGYRGTRRWPR